MWFSHEVQSTPQTEFNEGDRFACCDGDIVDERASIRVSSYLRESVARSIIAMPFATNFAP